MDSYEINLKYNRLIVSVISALYPSAPFGKTTFGLSHKSPSGPFNLNLQSLIFSNDVLVFTRQMNLLSFSTIIK